jgi:hypothetical protein
MNRLKMSPLARTASGLVLVATLFGCSRTPDTDARMVSEWMHTLYGVVRTERISPPIASRFMGYASVALHEGLAAVPGGPPSLVGALNGLSGLPTAEPDQSYDGTVVALASERVAVDSLLSEALPATRSTVDGLVDSLRASRAAEGVNDAVRQRSESLGTRIGLAIVAWSRTDGFDSTRGRPYPIPAGSGLWINDSPASVYASQSLSAATDFVGIDNPANNMRPGTSSDRGLILNRPKRTGLKTLLPVNMAGATEPYWWQIRPFVLSSWSECPLAAPPPYSTDPASPMYQQAKTVHETGVRLTADQKNIALYWADNPGESGTPSGHWVSIAAQMISQAGLSANDAARLFVVSAVAQADAFIAVWGYKFRHNLIRPRTYIRRVIDPKWEPLIPTPPFPEYPSGHSGLSAAAATTIAGLVGEQAFDDSTGQALGPGIRRFQSFREAADEAGQSRVYGGIHFDIGNEGGKSLGRCTGQKVLERVGAPPAQ